MNKLKARLKSGKACVNAWLAIPSGFSAEVMAQCGFDSVTVDMQHGVQDYLSGRSARWLTARPAPTSRSPMMKCW
jgi:2-keto-3-deoxy-L-rhamnonate aldolase RhmA